MTAPNVSAVPQYSPLRYPGGKSRFHPFVKKWIKSKVIRPSKLIEPFAGASHVGLAAAIEDMVDYVVLADIDEDVSAVWTTILSNDYQWLIFKISQFHMSKHGLNDSLNNEMASIKERAFQVILRNRVSRGGVTAPGAGTLEHGENGKGLSSRWYPTTLKRRIEKISKVRDKIEFVMSDGLKIIKDYSEDRKNIFFIDPPYPISGRRLYKHFDVSPEPVFELACSIVGDFLITYEDTPEIRQLVSEHSLQSRRVWLSTAHHRKKIELLISRDLSWLK